MPFVSLFLILATAVLYFAGNLDSLALWPVHSPEFRPWQLLTYAFVHGNALHLAVNLLALLSFGPALERAWGRTRFLAAYVAAAGIGGVLQALIATGPVVGASAALFGLFAAWVVANPRKRVVSIVPWPLPAWQVLLFYVAASIAALIFGWLPGLAHAAHLGGVAVGLMLAANNKPRR